MIDVDACLSETSSITSDRFMQSKFHVVINPRPKFKVGCIWASVSAMATRLARFLSTSSRLLPESSWIKRPKESTTSPLLGQGASGIRCASSSPSSDSSDSTPSKRGKKCSDRLSAVIDAVHDRKLPPELRGQRNSVSKEYGIQWKKVNLRTYQGNNPHADPAEDTLYRILSKNGCAPEWVELNKEIRSTVSEWRVALKKAWTIKCRGDHSKWVEYSEALKVQMHDINDKVFRYNLIVPFGRQMFGLKWEKEVARLQE